MYFGVDNFTFEWYDSKTVIESKARTERTGHSCIHREMAVGVSHDARDIGCRSRAGGKMAKAGRTLPCQPRQRWRLFEPNEWHLL